MANLIERLQAKLELFRLEQRYTRRRHRRSTFVSNAVYVDGEYIYQTPASTGSSAATSATAASSKSRFARSNTGAASASASPAAAASATSVAGPSATTAPAPAPVDKIRNRLSMPSFGSKSASPSTSRTQDWRTARTQPTVDERY